ncbi:hypothetical protein CHS0354_001080 [Potamilus streckersoni]|uniref:Uncharacterized protein n=1 Tax=Potamilus streckersoni TaxID=2493646 RepID=A0AAE0RVP1_9BIVA|nr:hypothetical protein CHS0354_001080 [Potamilus streckersoni]
MDERNEKGRIHNMKRTSERRKLPLNNRRSVNYPNRWSRYAVEVPYSSSGTKGNGYIVSEDYTQNEKGRIHNMKRTSERRKLPLNNMDTVNRHAR